MTQGGDGVRCVIQNMEAMFYDLIWKVDLLLKMEEKREVRSNLKIFGAGPSKLGPIPMSPDPKKFKYGRLHMGPKNGAQAGL